MENNPTNLFNNMEEDPIDIIVILKNAWAERILIFKTTISFFIIGCILALISPVVYTSETTFVPQVSEDQMSVANKGLGSIASLAGINLNAPEMTSDSYLSPVLYSKLAESDEFAYNIIMEEIINLNGDKKSIKQYLLSNKSLFSFSTIKLIKKYTIGLFLNIEPINYYSDVLIGYKFLNEEDYYLVQSFKEKFAIELNEKDGYIKVAAYDEDAFISTQLVQKITENMQSKIIELRTNKIKERLGYSKEQYELKQIEFDFLQNKLAEFKDSNKNISTASFRAELQKLESETQLQQNILVNLASEYNNNKIKLNKNTPIFSVIDEVSVPNERSKPKRTQLVFISMLIGLVLSVCFVLAREPVINLIKEIKN